MGKEVNVDISLDEHIKQQKQKARSNSSRQRNPIANGNNSRGSQGNNRNNSSGKNVNRGNQSQNGSQGGQRNQSQRRRPNNDNSNQNGGQRNQVRRTIRKGFRNRQGTTNNANPQRQGQLTNYRPRRTNQGQGQGQGQSQNSNQQQGQGRVQRQGNVLRRTGAAKPAELKTVKNLKRIIVSNIPTEITNGEVFELFNQFGTLEVCKIRYDKLGKSYGIAVVEYKDEAHAKKAVREYNGAQLDNKILTITYATKKVPANQLNQSSASSYRGSLKSRIIPRAQAQRQNNAAANTATVKKQRQQKIARNNKARNQSVGRNAGSGQNNGGYGNGNGNGRAQSQGGYSRARSNNRNRSRGPVGGSQNN